MKIGRLRINMIKSEAFVDASNAYANVGESVQAVAISYIYRQLGITESEVIKIDQCEVKQYMGEKVILPLRLPISSANVDEFFPLPSNIIPVFMSLHLHDDIFAERQDLVDYFKRYEPIGCRDEYSCGYFRKYGIESYIMGCYTLCLPKREVSDKADKVYLVDVSKELEVVIPGELKQNMVSVSHAVPFLKYPVTHEEDQRLVDLAGQYLNNYVDNAKLVITGRIHAAAPCMAMGIPVILATNNADFRYAWIDRFLPIYQESDYAYIDWKPEAVDVSKVRQLLFEFFEKVVTEGKADRNCLQNLDAIYRERNKTQYYKCFRSRILKLREKYASDAYFTYAIWGAGCHALFAHDLMSEMYPNAELRVVIDKYKNGTMFGVPIERGDHLKKYSVDHVCITTNPGKAEAIEECERISPRDHLFYTIMTSQQLS